MSTDITPPGSVEQIITIPWELLHDSPLQYRQTYREETIAEIAATIVDTGRIHQPLVVRRHFPNPLFRDQYDPQDGYEIVFGHTRKRAGMRTHLAGGPCVVRELNDAQVRAAQAAENVARADVHPLEEAQGFRAMIDEDGITADELATQLGKSRSFVYGRLKLLALCPEVRRAVLAKEIDTEVGLLIARVGGHKMQDKALAYIKAKYYSLEDGGKKSFRQIRDLLNERFTLDLKSAIFNVDDEMLVPAAGYCGRCPKRSGNAPEFADVVAGDNKTAHYGRQNTGADICTDPDCFDTKKRAHLAREAAKLEADGKTVVTGNKARQAMGADGQVKGAYVELARVKQVLKDVNKKTTTPLAVVLIQDQRTGKTVQAVKREDLQQAGGVKLPEPTTRSNGDSPAEREKREKERQQRADQLAKENTRRRALLDQVRAAMRATERSTFDLRLVAQTACEGVQWNDRPLLSDLWGLQNHADLAATIATLSLPDLTQFIMDCALVANVHHRDAYYLKDKAEALDAAAVHYGLAAHEPTPTPGPAGASAKKAKAGAGKKGGEPDGQAKAKDPTAGGAGGDQMDGAGDAGGSAAQIDAFAEGTA